ncbi:Leu/Phe/Val dehydrogenase [Amycolatopsis pithecellobii]|uniref:Valine dehydrogenase n=1 Tax=Amycolatopsis pithecellobii TaxID=664692 RepID=A0A6N7ZCX2_9PSEU|nr:Glu/Leu/Phe/Val dehydrogenase dimerization domain-containing protein [Amycolatopsis pithecellobii]MTD59651.1 valine dehydrogenase [Amycolatopsis pithecellobii]
MTGIFERKTGHEQVVFCNDNETGLRAIIAIYSTSLGPALGGVRFYPYADEESATNDVLNLSKGMAYKNAVAGLHYGGGKAVIFGTPETDKTQQLLWAYARFVESLGGRYITACDLGTTIEDMDVISGETTHVAGRSRRMGGAGDPSSVTAYGVYRGMAACAEVCWGVTSLRGRSIGVSGVGKVGTLLVELLVAEGASVVVYDVDERALEHIQRTHPAVEVAADHNTLISRDLDVYAPCSIGGVLDRQVAERLRCSIVCGAANNQLSEPTIAQSLHDRCILYAPDYVVNAGGVLHVAGELDGFDSRLAKHRASEIYDTMIKILRASETDGLPPVVIADRLAERIMSYRG